MVSHAKVLNSMTLKTPEIGIALAAYKPDPKYFSEQLLSIISQTEENWICVVTFDSEIVDTGITDSRIHYIQNESRLGHVKNFERAMSHCLNLAPGVKYLAFSDQDDVWYPEKLSVLRTKIETLPPMSGVHSNMNLLFPDGTRVDGWNYEGRVVEKLTLTDLCLRNVCTGAAALFDASLFRQFPIIPKEIEDHDHWYALLASHFGELAGVDQCLYDYRQHENNVIGAQKSASLFKLRKKRLPLEVIKGFVQMHRQFETRVKALPVGQSDNATLLSYSNLVSTLVRSIFSRNRMLTRSAITALAGRLLRRFFV